MVGEIRDGETAELAVQAALTGHLVFSTLHTNNAATCLPRLLDMDIEPFLIASTVRVVIGQRLVRRLCLDCREVYKPDEAELKQLAKAFSINTDSIKHIHELESKALEDGIGKAEGAKLPTNELSTTASGITKLYKAHDDGCANCNHTGFKGRIGIYEVLPNNEEIQKLIVSSGTSEVINREAINEGMLTMQTDGFIKSLRGETTIAEVLRVTASEG
jgi:type II secretory ATPase GspE/PulE/Tfp pilus assembly ATPase PilB-like protein